MRPFFALFITLHVAVMAGHAEPTPRQPKIEGRVSSVSQKDIRDVIVLAERDMRHEFGRVISIDRIEIRDRNHMYVFYSYGGHGYVVPMKRIHNVWTPPPPGIYVT